MSSRLLRTLLEAANSQWCFQWYSKKIQPRVLVTDSGVEGIWAVT
jgi:hypothetical protein